MATVAQIAKASLQKILFQAAEAPLEADEYQDFIFSMNAFMAALAATGINLGYTIVSGLGDDVTIPIGALRGLIYNMAVEVAADYSAPIPESVAIAARDGMVAMRMLGQTMSGTRMPGTLPIGSGNEGKFNATYHFYADQEATILGETGQPIALEVNT